MALIPDPPFPKSQGDTLRSADWNAAVNEVIRLDGAKVNRAGDAITGNLSVQGRLGIGSTSPDRQLTIQSAAGSFLNCRITTGPVEVLVGADSSGGALSTMTNHDLQLRAGGNSTKAIIKASGNVGIGLLNPASPLHVADHMTVGPFPSRLESAVGRFEVSGPSAELGFIRRDLTAFPATPAAGDRYVWYNPDGTARLFTEVKGDLLTVDSLGNVTLTGELRLPKTSGGLAAFTNEQLNNESTFRPNNLKLRMGFSGIIIPGQPPFQYEFAVGHQAGFFVGNINFVKRFSINENGDLFCAGSKTGYVVDYFINQVGDTLEQGDVVIIAPNGDPRYYGSNGDIPIPEVDLTSKAYDPCVCGIVAKFVTEADLPAVDPQPLSEEEAAKLEERGSPGHPLAAFAARPEQKDHTKVAPRQLGKMATLGAFAHCKVDADIAPILAGDLLTTSPTKGHAQKVLEPSKALGAIVGKALAPLKRGKGKIPVLVMLQ